MFAPGSQSVGPGPATGAAALNLLEMAILGLIPDVLYQKLGGEASKLYGSQPSRGRWWAQMVESPWCPATPPPTPTSEHGRCLRTLPPSRTAHSSQALTFALLHLRLGSPSCLFLQIKSPRDHHTSILLLLVQLSLVEGEVWECKI